MGISFSEVRKAALEDLVSAAQDEPSDDSPSMNEIVRRFQGRAWSVAMALTSSASVHPDLVQAALLALTRAVRRHHRDRAGFVTYAMRYMQGGASRELARFIDGEPVESLSDPATWSAACTVAAPAQPVGVRAWGYGPAAVAVMRLVESQRELLTSRYIGDQSLRTIAVLSGTSIPAVSQRLATAHKVVAAQLVA